MSRLCREQLRGGRFDGLDVETINYPNLILLPDGTRYWRRRDGDLYAEDCKWDEKETT